MLFRCAIKWFGIASLIFAFSLYFTKISKGRPEKKPVLLFKMGVTRYRDSGEFYQGEPIFIHLGLRRMDTNETPREKPLRIGTEQLPWYKNVSFCLYKFEEEPEDKRLPRTSSNDASRASSAAESPIEDIRNKETSGSNSVPVSSSTAEPTREETKYENIIDKNAHTKKATLIEDVNVSLIGPQPKKNKLKIHDSVRSFWVVEPNFTSKLLPGKYMIQATFDTTDKWESHPKIFHGKYLSNKVNLVINQPQRDTVRAEVLSTQGMYFRFHQKYNEEIKLLKKALKLNPKQKNLHVRLGRSYQLKGDVENAIKEYQAYVEWVRSLNLPRTGKDDLNDHADIIEREVQRLKQKQATEKKE